MSLVGGSLRIYERDVQEKMFKALGFSQEEAQEQFGFLLEAFEYGTPPHGGIALGLDRLVMLLAGRTNLRDTIAFPKTASASCLLTEAPSPVAESQLEELNLKIKLERREVRIGSRWLYYNRLDFFERLFKKSGLDNCRISSLLRQSGARVVFLHCAPPGFSASICSVL